MTTSPEALRELEAEVRARLTSDLRMARAKLAVKRNLSPKMQSFLDDLLVQAACVGARLAMEKLDEMRKARA